MKQAFNDAISNYNFDVIACMAAVIKKNRFFNIGFFSFLLLAIILFVQLLSNFFHAKEIIEEHGVEILRNDCIFYDPMTVSAEIHFNSGSDSPTHKRLSTKESVSTFSANDKIPRLRISVSSVDSTQHE